MARTLHLKDECYERRDMGEVERRMTKIEKRIEKVGHAVEPAIKTEVGR